MLKIEDSSSVAEVGYDSGRSVMAVRFVTGSLYEYEGVPPKLFSDIVSAESVGRMLDRQVKKYPIDHPCTKIEEVVRLKRGAILDVQLSLRVEVLDVSDSHGLQYHLQCEQRLPALGRSMWVLATELTIP